MFAVQTDRALQEAAEFNGRCRPGHLSVRWGGVPDAYRKLLTAISTAVLLTK